MEAGEGEVTNGFGGLVAAAEEECCGEVIVSEAGGGAEEEGFAMEPSFGWIFEFRARQIGRAHV